MALGRTQFEKLVKRKMETGKINRIKLIGQVMSYYKEGINVMTPDFKVYLSWACALGMCSSNGNPVYCRELLNAIKTNMENSEAPAQTVSAATWTADEFDSIWDNSGMMNLNLSGALTREYKEAVNGAKEAEDALGNSDDLFRQAAENSQPIDMSEANSGDDEDLLSYYEEGEGEYEESDYEEIEDSTEDEVEYDYEAEYGEVADAEEGAAEAQTEITVADDADTSKEDDAEQYKKEDDLLNALLDNFAVQGCITKALKAVTETLYELYSPNLSGIPHEGLFMPMRDGGSPLWSFKASTGDVINKPEQVYDSGTQLDLTICNVMEQTASCISNYLTPDRETGFPTLENLGKCPYMLEAQLMFQSANIRLSGHLAKKNSIRHWNTLTKAGANVESSRLDKLSDYKKWLTWVINRQYARYIVEAIGEEEIKQYMGEPKAMLNISEKLNNIASQFNAALRNVIVVRERRRNDKDDMETTSIATIVPSIDPVRVAEELVQEGVLNASGSTKVKAKGNIVNDIKTIKIAYDGNFVATDIFSGEIVDKLMRAGVRPRWDKVILGMNANGDIIYHDFKKLNKKTDSLDYVYTIYGGTGSGKGNMTLSLLSAAILDGCRVFYIDGKPDSGYAFGLQAWKEGKEAFMFDGQPKIGDPKVTTEDAQVEEMPYINRVRSATEKEISLGLIPDSLFVGIESDRMLATAEFLGVTRYLRGIQFWVRSIVLNNNPDDWAVYVFDELTSMSNREAKVRNMLYERAKELFEEAGLTDESILVHDSMLVDKVMKKVLQGFDLGKVKEKLRKAYSNAIENIEGLRFINQWCKWTDTILNGMTNLRTIGIRKSSATTIIIFQEAKWIKLAGADDKSYTKVRAFAQELGAMSTKFVGRRALDLKCGVFGQSEAFHSDWYNRDVMPDGALGWAMTTSSTVMGDDSGVKVFKPFSCWGYVFSMKETRISDSTPFKERYFEYNIGKMAEALNVDVGASIQRAYDWANKVLTENSIGVDLMSGNGDAVKRYMYNASNFDSANAIKESGAVSSAKAGAQGGAQGGAQSGPNFDDLEDDDRPTNNNLSFNSSASNAETNGGAVSNSQFETPKSTEANQFNPNESGAAGTVGNANSGNNSGANGQASSEASYGNLFNGSALGTSPSVNMGGATEVEDKDAVPIDTDTNVAVARVSQATATRGSGSNTTIDLANTEKSTPAAQLTQGKDGNSIPVREHEVHILEKYSEKQRAAIMDSPKKYNKFLDAAFNGIIDAIIKERGGRMAVRRIELDSNKLFVDSKLVITPDTIEYMGPDYMLELVSYPDIFGAFPKLGTLVLDTAMFGLFEEQIEPFITDADIANGDDNAAWYVLRHNVSMNTVSVKGVHDYKKADLLAKDRKEAMRLRRERIANKAERSLKSRLNKVKSDRGMPTAPKRTFDGKAAVRKIAGKSVRGVGAIFRGIGRAIAFLARHSH